MKHILLFACLSTGYIVHATTIAVLYRPTRIVVAADTLGVSHRKIAGSQEFLHCKIHPSGGLFFASTGYTSDEAVGFDATKTTNVVLQSSIATFSEKVEETSREILPLLLAGAQLRHGQLSPQEYAQFVRITPEILTILVVGVERQKINMATITFVEEDDPKANTMTIKPRIKQCVGAKCGSGAFFLGYNQTALRYTEDITHRFWTGDDALDARRVVDIEIEAEPKEVGGPVDVLVLNADGSHRWDPPYGECGSD